MQKMVMAFTAVLIAFVAHAAPTSTAPTKAPAPAKATKQTTMPPKAIHLEAESAQLTGTQIVTNRAGFSGAGYLSGFDADGDKATWTIPNAASGLYDARVCYNSSSGEKGFDLVVNGRKTSSMFEKTDDAWSMSAPLKVELKQGENTLSIEKSWGYYDIDAIDLTPAVIDMALKKVPATLADPKASAPARALMRYLTSSYGAQTLSGQTGTPDAEYIRGVSGKRPAVMASDFIEYSPTRVEYGSKPGLETEKMIQLARDGHIITMHWHWNAPAGLLNKEFTDAEGKVVKALWWSGFYTYATTFDLQKALADTNSPDYKLLLRDIDVIAVQLKKLNAAGVPVLWRPLHEAEGGWFWWGAKGPEPFKQLWRLMFDRITKHHQIHNLIWVHSSGIKPEWYPGDAYVDIVGIDQYPSDWSDPLSGNWDILKKSFDGRKMLALTEMGGAPDVEKMRRYGVLWSYFVSWQGDLGPRKIPAADLSRIYKSPLVITRDESKSFAPLIQKTATPVKPMR